LNTLRGAVSLLAVKAPGFGERRKEMLQDLAVLTGGKVISAEMGATLETTTLAELGRASKVLATKDYTTIIAGAGDPLAIQAHLQSLRHELEASTSDYDREKLQERLAKLSGGVAVVQVGAATETELHEKKYRLDDALHATRAAIEAGIVPGGGVALLNARAALADLRFDDADINTGVNVVRSALEVPLRRIAENAGLAGSVIMTNIYQQQRLQQNPRIGYDILTDTYVDMIEAGIPDPMKVTRSALESAASIAAMILTIEALVAEAPAGGLQRVKMP
jgi:chaperonin GroEL